MRRKGFISARRLSMACAGHAHRAEEVFGPVLNVMNFDDLDSAIEMANQTPFGNGACIYTQSGKAAREFKHRIKAGMIGINVGVPAPLAYFPFAGWDYSFFGDLHLQGKRRRDVLHESQGHHLALVPPWRRRHLAQGREEIIEELDRHIEWWGPVTTAKGLASDRVRIQEKAYEPAH
jgi:hypothetical protein